MWAAVLACLAVAAFGAVWLKLIPPPQAMVLVKLRNGVLRVRKGRLEPAAKEHVAEILAEERISRGWIAILTNRRITCSRGIPCGAQQRLRNVLVNRDLD